MVVASLCRVVLIEQLASARGIAKPIAAHVRGGTSARATHVVDDILCAGSGNALGPPARCRSTSASGRMVAICSVALHTNTILTGGDRARTRSTFDVVVLELDEASPVGGADEIHARAVQAQTGPIIVLRAPVVAT